MSSASVEQVFTSAVFVPCAPLLVPELAGPDALDTEPVRAHTLHAATGLAASARRWLIIGAGDAVASGDGRSRPDRWHHAAPVEGTFARFGIDVPVTLDPARSDTAPTTDTLMPLSMLIGAWLRDRAGAERADGIVIDQRADPETCARIGAEIAASAVLDPEPTGLLVVGDGAISLSPKAPGGGLRPSAVALQTRIDAALGGADLTALASLGVEECADEGVCGRVAWQAAAAVASSPARTEDHPGLQVETDYLGAPFGVGYVVARWTL